MTLARLKDLGRKELQFFRDAPMLSVAPTREIAVLVGAGSHLFVQTQYNPAVAKQEQDAEVAHLLLAAANMMAHSAGLIKLQFGPPPEGVPNG